MRRASRPAASPARPAITATPCGSRALKARIPPGRCGFPAAGVQRRLWDPRGFNQFLKGDLLLVETLFDAAQRAGMSTVAIGKTGAAFIQDYRRGGMLLDEKTVLPLSLAKELQ